LKANACHPNVLHCESWVDFVEKSKRAGLLAFECVEGKGLTISAVYHGKIYKYTFTAKNFKAFLTQQLNVREEKVVEGEVVFPRTCSWLRGAKRDGSGKAAREWKNFCKKVFSILLSPQKVRVQPHKPVAPFKFLELL